jgi:hypothetical protein
MLNLKENVIKTAFYGKIWQKNGFSRLPEKPEI